MIGWHISVYQQSDGGNSPATLDATEGTRIAVWQSNEYGLRWLDELAAEGKAVDLGGNGYPNRYTATAEHLLPRILAKPPEARDIWIGEGTVDPEVWVGKTLIDGVAAGKCRLDEWLLVEAWDES
jgi:hypothetical protein